MSEKYWFYALDGKEQGPVAQARLAELIAAGTIGRKTLVWTEGMADWRQAASVLPAGVRPPSWGGAPVPPPVAAAATAPDGGEVTGFGRQGTDHPGDFVESVKACFSRYATFSGRARRPEFWWFALFNFIANFILTFLDSAIFGFGSDFAPLGTLYSLAVLIPSLAVGARRLHDIDRSGWWQLIALIPLIGWIVLIVWYAKRGDDGENRFGPA